MEDGEEFIIIPPHSPCFDDDLNAKKEDDSFFDDLLSSYAQEEEVMESVSTQTEDTLSPQPWHLDSKPDEFEEHTLLNTYYNNKDYMHSSEDACYFFPKSENMSPTSRRMFGKNDRTPCSALRMMERHRENERARHHNLNDSLGEICKRVPGSSTCGGETKVVMMQRIISYVSFLENTVVDLCSDLGISYSNSSVPLTTQLSKSIEQRKRQQQADDSTLDMQHPPIKRRKIAQKLKVSSPTIDSTTTEHMLPRGFDNYSEIYSPPSYLSADDNTLSSWLVTAEGLDDIDHYVPLLNSSGYNIDYNQSSSFKNYTSCSNRNWEFECLESRAVAPNKVLPSVQIPSSSSAFFSPSSSSSSKPRQTNNAPLIIIRNKRKQYTPKKSVYNDFNRTKENQNYNIDLSDYSYLQGLRLTRRQKSELTNLQIKQYSSVSESAKDNTITKYPAKIDLRKTSWMNGFMMFSRLNRKSFINANPGVHTSVISKMMGHAWRNMSSDEQGPYKEKAKECAMELQKQQEIPQDFNVRHGEAKEVAATSYYSI